MTVAFKNIDQMDELDLTIHAQSQMTAGDMERVEAVKEEMKARSTNPELVVTWFKLLEKVDKAQKAGRGREVDDEFQQVFDMTFTLHANMEARSK